MIEYNPWIYNDPNSLVTGFLDLMEYNIHGSAGEFKRYKQMLIAAENRVFGTSFSGILSTNDLDLGDTKQRINTLLQKSKYLYVVSVDDLDRLTGEEVINVFKLIRAVADFSNVIYIVAYDRNYVEKVLSPIVPSELTSTYLEKIFQVDYVIPEPEPAAIIKTLLSTIELKLSQFYSLRSDINPIRIQQNIDDLRQLQGKQFLFGIIKTMRDVKRFTNNLLFRYFSIYRDVDFIDFFYLELIRYKNHDSYANIFAKRENILRTLTASYTGMTRTENLIKDEEMNSLIFKGQKEIQTIFQELTSSRVTATYPFYNKLFFDKYFTLDHYSNQISEEDFNNILGSNESDSIVTAFVRLVENGADEDFAYKIARIQLNGDQVYKVLTGCIYSHIRLYKIDQLNSINRQVPSLATTCITCFFKNKIPKRTQLLLSIYKKSNISDLGYLSYFLQGFIEFQNELRDLLKADRVKLPEFEWIRRHQLMLMRKLIRSKTTDVDSLAAILMRVRWFIPNKDNGTAIKRYFSDVWLYDRTSHRLHKLLPEILQWILIKSTIRTTDGQILKGKYSSRLPVIYFNQVFVSEKAAELFLGNRLDVKEFIDFLHAAEVEGNADNDLVEFNFRFIPLPVVIQY